MDSISINNIFNNDIDNSFKMNSKDNNKDTINLNNNMSINNVFNNPINFPSQNSIKSPLFQFQNNNMNINNNCIYNNFNPGIILNPPNDIFINHLPKINSIPNNMNINAFNTGPNSIQNSNFGNEIRSNLFGETENKNNLDSSNLPFFQIPIQNPISLSQIPNTIVSNNIMKNSIPNNNFLISNNTNINTNSNIKINKNINNIINLDNTNIINSNINNNIKINSNQNINENMNEEEANSNKNNNPINTKIKFSAKQYTAPNISKNNIPPKNQNIETNLPPKKATPLFNIKATSKPKEKINNNKLTTKKRKRFIKNNKLVFVQVDKENENKKEKNDKERSELNEENKSQDSLNSEKVSELMQKNTKPRGSRYRGVSKNGSQWQVLIMVKKKKRYLGSFSNEEEAARAYDKVALQHHGTKAKTNYDYTKEEVKEIMAAPLLLKLE